MALLSENVSMIFPHQTIPKRYTWPFLSPLIIRVSDESMTMESQYLFFVDVISQQSTTTMECLACTVHCHEYTIKKYILALLLVENFTLH